MKKLIAIALVLMLCISALSIAAFAAGTITVYVSIDSATAPNAWAWGGYGNAFTSWPGNAMTKDGDWYKIEVPTGTTGFIANNGSAQTSDIAISGDKDVWITVSSDFKTYSVSYDGGNTVAPPPAAPAGYFVTGSADWLGNWAECNQAGKMTESNGIYVKEFTGVAAGDYKLKVNDGTWNNSWGNNGQDLEFNVAEANSTVIVKFNPADSTVTVTVNGSNAGGNEPAPAPTPTFDAYYVAGTAALCNGKEWDAGAAENLMTKGDNGIWTITYTNVPAGEYELKVTAGSWDNNWGANGAANGENVKITIEEAGDVTVKFNPSNGWISVYHNDNPLTNDVSLAGIGIALLAATAGVVALVGKKKEF